MLNKVKEHEVIIEITRGDKVYSEIKNTEYDRLVVYSQIYDSDVGKYLQRAVMTIEEFMQQDVFIGCDIEKDIDRLIEGRRKEVSDWCNMLYFQAKYKVFLDEKYWYIIHTIRLVPTKQEYGGYIHKYNADAFEKVYVNANIKRMNGDYPSFLKRIFKNIFKWIGK